MRLQIGAPLRSAAQRSDPPGSRGGSGHSSGVPIAPNGSRAHCKEAIMAQIGSFTRADNGIYTGEIRTLTLRSEEHTSELQSLLRISYAVFCSKITPTHILPRTSQPHTSNQQ